MQIGRFIGWTLIATAIVVAGYEFYLFFAGEKYRIHSLGQLWYVVNRASLNATQAGIQRHIWPPLWDPILITGLRAPAWPALALIGVAFAWFCRDRRKRSFR